MKFNIKIVYITLFALLFSCSDDEYGPVLDVASITMDLNASTSQFDMDLSQADDTVVSFSWTEPTLPSNIILEKYQIFMDVAGNDFQRIKKVDAGLNLSYDMTASELNVILLNHFLIEVDQPVTLELQVMAIAGNATIAASNIVTITTAPYADALDLTTPWGLVGSATTNGWDGPDMPFYQVPGQDNVFAAYVTLVDGEIKIRYNNDWGLNYGDDGADGSLEENGANIAVTAGHYKVTFDSNNLTYSIEPFSIGLIGSATPGGWDNDTDMMYDPTSDQFRLVLALVEGEAKFRYNDSWETNYGDTGLDGTLDQNGDNIPVSAGNYVVTFNPNDFTYSFEEIPNIWGLVGSATPNGWDGPDLQLMLDYTSADYSVWYLNGVSLVDGEMKFRADNDWGLNLGSDGGAGTLTENGDNIPVTAGTYNVMLNRADNTYTLEN